MTSQSLAHIYHQEMIALTQHPQFFVDSQCLPQCVTVKNPLCGDWVSVGYIQKNICWHGEGCLICRASIEALCQMINMSTMCFEETLQICQKIMHYFDGQSPNLPDRFKPLSSVKQVKSRIKCVTLPIQAVTKLCKGNPI